MFHITIPGLKYLCAKYSFCFIHIGEKRLRQAEPSAPPPQHPNWEISPSPTEDVEEGEVGDMGTPQEVGDMCTPPRHVEPFSTDSAQRLIGQIMACWNGDIDAMRNWLDSTQQEMKNMIDVLGRI
ncbi:hypothetical protein AB205_0082600 [Aquarana catesbeiana]|uniref:Uncharacterized protein n=1 Tax=Aquarana catesbeiana TaxID=8400 RepID=A0A2G9Q2S5_AQUCT|nr:hypothetical protein AB205_0082600 [Aquarana catesbeiana]